MKKLSFLSIIFAVLFLTAFQSINAQGVVGVKSYSLETVSNSVDESYITGNFAKLIKEFGCNKIDSLVISVTVDGEADIDSLEFYPCNWTIGGTKVLGTVVHHTVTLNVAAAGTGTEILLNSNHGVQPTSFRGFEGFAILTRGSASGNDPTDPNSGKVTIVFYGS
ncbi:MAG: hypothetical protein IPL84_03755 [Chitinophagaceae bacterium]|nr:hypothetical protein [Chitinophagaceae bacterium]